MRRPQRPLPMTSTETIPDDVRRFVLTSLPSVPHLEALLLFHGAPQAPRHAREVARLLYTAERAAAELLEHLCEAGMLACDRAADPLYRYEPRDPALHEMIDRLAAVYASNLIAVTNLIHDSTHKNARRFADAFKLRKER